MLSRDYHYAFDMLWKSHLIMFQMPLYSQKCEWVFFLGGYQKVLKFIFSTFSMTITMLGRRVISSYICMRIYRLVGKFSSSCEIYKIFQSYFSTFECFKNHVSHKLLLMCHIIYVVYLLILRLMMSCYPGHCLLFLLVSVFT